MDEPSTPGTDWTLPSDQSSASSPSSASHSTSICLFSASIPRSSPFCCSDCHVSRTDDSAFKDFCNAASKTMSAVDDWSVIIHSVQHVIELVSSFSTHNQHQSSRYFVCLDLFSEYREVGLDFVEYLGENRNPTLNGSAWFTCDQHQRGFSLSRYEYEEETFREGFGLRDEELSPQQVSREKRMIMVRKLSYGRQEEIEEYATRLNIAAKDTSEDYFGPLLGRERNIVDAARTFTMNKEEFSETMALHLARASLFSESRLC